MQRTSQQQAFIESLQSSTSSIALMARAGSGKTTTLIDGAQGLSSGLFVAFNKLNADTLSKRMPETVVCKTMNSLGHNAWGRHLSKRLVLEDNKLFKIASDLVPGDYKKQYMGEFMQLVRLFKSLPILPVGAPGSGTRDDEHVWLGVIEEFDLDFGSLSKEFVITIARRILLESIKQAWSGVIDFSDQLYMPVVYKARFQQYPLVGVDEAQDLSPLQHAMVAASMGPSSRLIAVGDPHQAIYAWRGAASDSMSILSQQFHCVEMPLTVSFRCSQAVIREAQKFVPDIEWAPGAEVGDVLPEVDWDKRKINDGDWIVCRNNRPLVKAFFALAKAGRKAKIRGRTMGTNLAKLVDRISENNEFMKYHEFVPRLISWAGQQCAAFIAEGKDAKASDVRDRAEVIRIVGDNQPVGCNLQQVKMAILTMFSDEGGAPIVLSTIHKAKGLEAPVVHFLDRDLIPSPWATGDARAQEFNLAYVAITRAQKTLSYLRSPSHD